MKRNTVMLAVTYDMYQEAKNYITEMLTKSLAFNLCACNKLMTSASLLKKLSGSGRFGKVAKLALVGDRSSPMAASMFE